MPKSYSVLSETEVTSNVASVDISLGHDFLVHEIVYCDITLSATPQTLQFRLSDDNGSTFESTSSYEDSGFYTYATSGTYNYNVILNGSTGADTSGCFAEVGSNSYRFGWNGGLRIYNAASSSDKTLISYRGSGSGGGMGGSAAYFGTSIYTPTSTITDIRLMPASGNFSSGTFQLIGVM